MKIEAGYQVETMEPSRFAAALVCLTIKDSFNVFQLYKYMDVEIEDSKKIEVKNRGGRTGRKREKIRGEGGRGEAVRGEKRRGKMSLWSSFAFLRSSVHLDGN